MKLVRLDEDVPDYWIELGNINLQLGDYRRAFQAFTRAHELDRTNVQVLAALTQLALTTGQVDFAAEQARSLALLAPDHPLVVLANSYVALQRGDLDKADAGVEKLLADSPNDSSATILKAHVLVAHKRVDDAIALLEQQRQVKPDDRAAIRSLAALYRSRKDWRGVARAQYDLHKLDPGNTNVSAALVEALLRAGNVAAARTASLPLLSAANPQLAEATLETWATYSPDATVMPGSVELAKAATGDLRAAFGDYFNRVGKSAVTLALLESARRPVGPANARWNAVFAQALALQSRFDEAKKLFDDVLEAEPDQVEGLRGRSRLELRMRKTKDAVIDAQRLVSITPTTGQDRLLLAQTYRAAGSERDVRRTLWQAFQDIPDDEQISAALRALLVSSGDLDGARRLEEEYSTRQMAKLTKELA